MPTIMPMSVVAVSCKHDDNVVQNHALHAELMLSWMTPSQYKAIWQGLRSTWDPSLAEMSAALPTSAKC